MGIAGIKLILWILAILLGGYMVSLSLIRYITTEVRKCRNFVLGKERKEVLWRKPRMWHTSESERPFRFCHSQKGDAHNVLKKIQSDQIIPDREQISFQKGMVTPGGYYWELLLRVAISRTVMWNVCKLII